MRLKYYFLTLVLFFLISCGNSDNAQIHFQAGMQYIGQNELVSAIKELNKAIKLQSDMAEVYYSLSYCYYELGNEKMGSIYKEKWREIGTERGYDTLKLEGILPKL